MGVEVTTAGCHVKRAGFVIPPFLFGTLGIGIEIVTVGGDLRRIIVGKRGGDGVPTAFAGVGCDVFFRGRLDAVRMMDELGAVFNDEV